MAFIYTACNSMWFVGISLFWGWGGGGDNITLQGRYDINMEWLIAWVGKYVKIKSTTYAAQYAYIYINKRNGYHSCIPCWCMHRNSKYDKKERRVFSCTMMILTIKYSTMMFQNWYYIEVNVHCRLLFCLNWKEAMLINKSINECDLLSFGQM